MEIKPNFKGDFLWRETDKAVFIYQMNKTGNLVFVEAKNKYAVYCLERFTVNRVRPASSCSLISINLDREIVERIHPDATEIPFHHFVLDVVDRVILLSDISVFNSFCSALTPQEFAEVRAKVDEALALEKKNRDAFFSDDEDEDEDFEPEIVLDGQPSSVVIPKPVLALPTSRPSPTAIKALCGLGFSKKDVERWAGSFDSTDKSMSDVIKAGCRAMARSA